MQVDGVPASQDAAVAVCAKAAVHLDASVAATWSAGSSVDADGRTRVTQWADVRGTEAGAEVWDNSGDATASHVKDVQPPFVSASRSSTGLTLLDFGERAAVEIHLVGAVKGPWLEYGTRDGVRRLNLPDGKAGARVKFQGPVLSGVRPLAFGCADPDAADVRIEIVKRYTDHPAADEPPAFVAVKEPTKWDLLAERLERDMKANGFDADEIRRTKARLLVECGM